MNEVVVHVKSEDRTDMDLIGRKVTAKAKTSFLKVGGHSGAAFAAGFIKTITLGQVGSGFAMAATKLKPQMAHAGGVLGVALAAGLAVKLASSLGALLSGALGGGILAGPLMFLWKTQEKAVGRLKKEAESFMKVISRPVEIPFQKSLKMIGDQLDEWGPKIRKAIKPLAKELPGFIKGLLKGIENFAGELGMDKITKGFKEWGKQLPGIGKALGRMVDDWMEDGPAMVESVQDLAGSLKDVAETVGSIGKGFRGFNKTNKNFVETMEGQRRMILGWRAAMMNSMADVATALEKLGLLPKRTAENFRRMAREANKNYHEAREEHDKTVANARKKEIKSKLKADKRDAQEKIRDINRQLTKTHNKKTESKLKAQKKQAADAIAEINRRLAALNGRTATTYIKTIYKGINAKNQGAPFHAAGGIIGGLGTNHAAEGGPRGGRVWVGEQGPELVDLPVGSRVHSNPDSQQMASKAGSRGGGDAHFHFHGPVYGDHNALKRALVEMKRRGELDVVTR